MDTRLTKAEEQIAHLTRAVDDLSDIVSRQNEELAALRRRLDLIIAREAERAPDAEGSISLANQRPPHW